jgi:tetratricopeptide (TPR) repeat protein
LTAKAARPKPKRAASEKAPVRKATPAKSSGGAKASPGAKSARPTAAKQTKRAAPPPKPSKGKVRSSAAAAPPKKAAPAKAKVSKTKAVAAKPQPKKGSPKAAATSKARPQKSAPIAKSAVKTAARPSARPAPAPPRQPTRDEAAALKAFERAHKEFTRGRFTDARNLFRALIEQHARVSEVTARARTYLSIAEARLRTEASLPRDPDSLYDRGVIELNRGDFVAAQEMFERALKRDPDAADTHYALAATRARLGAVESALQALARALELRPVLRVRAQTDSDLVALRNEPDFERIVFASSRA